MPGKSLTQQSARWDHSFGLDGVSSERIATVGAPMNVI